MGWDRLVEGTAKEKVQWPPVMARARMMADQVAPSAKAINADVSCTLERDAKDAAKSRAIHLAVSSREHIFEKYGNTPNKSSTVVAKVPFISYYLLPTFLIDFSNKIICINF